VEISIIIVNWNAKHYLRDCLDSLVAALVGIEHEIIVVDNASTDGSQEMVQSLYPNTKLICNNENLGFAKANNIGLHNCSGRFIFLINSDVVVSEDCFRRLTAFLDENSNVGLAGPKILCKNGLTQRSIMSFPTVWNTFTRALALDRLSHINPIFSSYETPIRFHGGTRKVEVVNGCFWAVRREALLEVGFLDERFFIYGEDIDFCRRFNDCGWQVVYYPDVSVIHFGEGSSSNAPIKFYIEMVKANFQLWKKYHRKAHWISFLVIVTFHHYIRLVGFTIKTVAEFFTGKNDYYKIKRNAITIKWALKEIFKA
jgi:GT2 family glycosyltransferase